MLWKIPLSLVTHGAGESAIMASLWDPYPRPAKITKVFAGEESLCDKINVAWAAFACAISSAFPVLLTGLDLGIPDELESAQGIYDLYTWSYGVIQHSGYRWWLDRMKSIKNWALFYCANSVSDHPPCLPSNYGAVMHKGERWMTFPWAKGLIDISPRHAGEIEIPRNSRQSSALFQVYLEGRANPTATLDKVKASYDQHYADMTRKFKTPDIVLEYARNYANEYGRQLKVKYESKKGTPVAMIPIRTSSTVGATKTTTLNHGGRSTDLRNALDAHDRGFTQVLIGDSDYYNAFGEIIWYADTLNLFYGLLKGNVVNVKNSLKYLSQSDLKRTMSHDQYVLRDVALQSLIDRGLLKKPTIRGYIGTGPLLGYFLKPPTDFMHTEDGVNRFLRVHAIEERGDKARIITIGDWEYVTLATYTRIAVYELMSFDDELPSLALEGGGKGLSSFMQRVKYWAAGHYGIRPSELFSDEQQKDILDKFIVSLDLTRCSDLIVPDLSWALFEAFLAGSGLLEIPTIEVIHHLTFGGSGLEYPDGRVVDTLTGGPLMGDPNTWAIDNLYTKFADDLACRLSDLKVTPEDLNVVGLEYAMKFLADSGTPCTVEFGRPLVSAEPKVHCGDDMIALKSLDQALMTQSMYGHLGGKVSEGTNLISKTIGVFCESLCRFGNVTTPLDVIEWKDILRVRNLCLPEGGGIPGQKEVPPTWTRGFAASNTLQWFKDDSPEHNFASRFVGITNKEFITRLHMAGLEPYLPQMLGGSGFPVSDEKLIWETSSNYAKMVMFLLNTEQSAPTLKALLNLALIGNLFTLEVVAGEFAAEDVQRTEDIMMSVSHYVTADLFTDGVNDRQMMADLEWKIGQGRIIHLGVEYFSISKAMSEIRTRLIASRGFHNKPPVRGSLPSLFSLGKKLKAWQVSFIEESGYSQTGFAGPGSEGIRKFVQSALRRRNDQMLRTFVPSKSIIEGLPTKSMPIINRRLNSQLGLR